MAPLSWRHHTLLQALLTRGPLPERDFHAVFAGVSGKNPGTPSAPLCLPACLLALLLSLLFARRSPTGARRNAPVPCRLAGRGQEETAQVDRPWSSNGNPPLGFVFASGSAKVLSPIS
jgi:hypothetical protein